MITWKPVARDVPEYAVYRGFVEGLPVFLLAESETGWRLFSRFNPDPPTCPSRELGQCLAGEILLALVTTFGRDKILGREKA